MLIKTKQFHVFFFSHICGKIHIYDSANISLTCTHFRILRTLPVLYHLSEITENPCPAESIRSAELPEESSNYVIIIEYL